MIGEFTPDETLELRNLVKRFERGDLTAFTNTVKDLPIGKDIIDLMEVSGATARAVVRTGGH